LNSNKVKEDSKYNFLSYFELWSGRATQ